MTDDQWVQNASRYFLLGIVCITPLLIWNSMMWAFYTPKELFLQLAIFVALLLQLTKHTTSVQLNLLDMVVGANFILVFLVTFLSRSTRDSFEALSIPIFVFIFYVLLQLSYVQEREEFRRFVDLSFVLIILSGTLMALYGILQHYGLDVLHPRGVATFGPKVVSTLGHANALGGYLAAIFPLALYNLRRYAKRPAKNLHILMGGLIIWALLLTVSRGAWLALAGALVIFNVERLRHLWQKHLASGRRRIAGVVVLTLGLVLPFWVVFRINPDSALGRLFIWRITWNMFADAPLIGIGYDRYKVEYLNYQAKFFDETANPMHFDRAANLKQADNEYLQILAESGIEGFLLFIILAISIYVMIYHILKAPNGGKEEGRITLVLASSITIVLLHSLVDNPLRNLPLQLFYVYCLGIISLMAKQLGLFAVFRSSRWSFHRNLVPVVTVLGLLAYSVLNVIDRGAAYIHWQNGQNFVEQGKWAEGIEEYLRAHSELPYEGEIQFHLGAAYAYVEQPLKALPLLEGSKTSFNDKNIYIVEGSALFQLGRYQEAEQSFRTALRMYPNLLLPRLWLAEMFLRTNREKEGISLLRQIATIQPKVLTDEAKRIKRDAERLLESHTKIRYE